MSCIRFLSRSILVLLLAVTSACSTTRPSRTGRMGWLEAMDRGKMVSSRRPAGELEQPSLARKGVLQGHRPVGVHPVPYNAPELDAVRLARWSRVADSIRLSWPLRSVRVTSHFGDRGGDPHEGIDLRASVGTPVQAAHDGVVLYSGSGISGYGKLVVIRHSAGISTVYGHNSRLLVRKGQNVRRGQRIALAGSTGRSSGPHLHFEVRTGLQPVDPLKLIALPKSAPPRRLSTRSRSTLAAAQRLR